MNINYYNNSSRYLKNLDIVTININDRSTDFPLTLKNIKFSNDDIQFFYNVDDREEGRLDLISFKVYGNSRYWWVIAIANQIEDALLRPIRGESLRIPSADSIQKYI